MRRLAAAICCATFFAAPAAWAERSQMTAIVALIEQKQCEEAYLRIGDVPSPSKPNADTEKDGRMLARVVSACRQKDPVIGFALSEKAMALAPADPAVQTAHAESLLALQQRGEAAVLLDRILKFHGDEARRARILRGKLAAAEADHDLAIRVLRPLEGDEQYGEEVARLMQESATALEQRHANKADLALAEADARQKAEKAEEALKTYEPGEHGGAGVAIPLRGKVGVGGEKVFTAKVKKGQSYVFTANGQCTRAAKKKKARSRMYEDPTRDIYGIDFAVQIGTMPPKQLSVGQFKTEKSEIPFIAEDDKLPIRVFDRSSVESGIKCSVTDFVVRSP